MKQLLTAFAVIILIAASACTTPKPPTDAAVEGSKVIMTLKDLSAMYEKKNLAGFMNSIADDFKERRAFSSSVDSVFSKYVTVAFTIQYSKMVITIENKGMAKAAFNWDSTWQDAGGSVLKNSGRATFVFEPKDAKLSAIEGKNPFVPQAIETPGK